MSGRRRVRGIMKHRLTTQGPQEGWSAIEQVRDSADNRVISIHLIEGPFTGTGAKLAAIRAAGTNAVLT